MPALPTALLAAACAGVLGWLGLTGFAFTDYDIEAAPAFLALLQGDWERFAALVPAYGGSFVLRAPFALAPALWGGGELAAFRAGSLAGIAACAALAAVVVTRMRAAGRPRLDRAVVLVAVAASPLALLALDTGHPEELLGAALCVAAVLAAPRHPLVAAVLLGLAVANKPWALVAVPAALAAAPAARRVAVAVLAGGVTLAVLAPLLLAGGGGLVEATAAAARTDVVFQPWQLWYLLGEPGRLAQSVSEGTRDLRSAPDWLLALSRPIILVVPVLLALGWWRRRAWRAGPAEPLLLLALALHLRCLLDPWNFAYYALPASLALAGWEGLRAEQRPPVLTLVHVAAVWLTMVWARNALPPDAQSVAYLAWSLPFAAVLAGRLFWGAHPRFSPATAGRYMPRQARCPQGLATQAQTPSP